VRSIQPDLTSYLRRAKVKEEEEKEEEAKLIFKQKAEL
jgi:hypothetical protein